MGIFPDLKHQKVMIVDDDLEWLGFLGPLMSFMTASVSDDPAEVENMLKQEPFDLLITDTNMPIMDGVTLLKKVRANAVNKNIVVVILFEGLHGSDITERDLFELGADLVFSKMSFYENIKLILEALEAKRDSN